MSHGSVEKCEPNMTPMLDLVLQLVMFFMLCANFIAEDTNAAIKLPSALQARPLDKAEDRVIFLNIGKDGKVFPPRGSTVELRNRVMVANYMKNQFDAYETLKKQAAEKGKDMPVPLVVVRAHQDARYGDIAQALLGCQEAGFPRLQFRAIVGISK